MTYHALADVSFLISGEMKTQNKIKWDYDSIKMKLTILLICRNWGRLIIFKEITRSK